MGEDLPDSQQEFQEYELVRGDAIKLVGEVRALGNSNYFSLADVREVSGVGPSLISNIKSILGETFTLEDLEVNSDSIKGMGTATLEKIKSVL